MKPIDDNLLEDEHRFDLLVDGELTPPQQRELLVALDDEPGGWRCCALAFLEAQCWQEEFGSIAREPVAAPAKKQPARRSWPGRHARTLLAMAASFLVALWVGWLVYGTGNQHPGSVRPPADALAGAAAPRQPAEKSDWPQSVPDDVHQQPDASSDPWRTVFLTGREGPQGKSESIQLPAVERERLDENWLKNVPAAMPPEVVQALQRTGYRVRQNRGWFPLKMRDGRRLVVPVDQVDVHYVDNPAL